MIIGPQNRGKFVITPTGIFFLFIKVKAMPVELITIVVRTSDVIVKQARSHRREHFGLVIIRNMKLMDFNNTVSPRNRDIRMYIYLFQG